MKRFLSLAALTAAAMAGSASADVTMSFNAAEPTLGAYDQYNLLDDATVPGGTAPGVAPTAGGTYNLQAYSDNVGPPGQTFRTPTGATAFKLNAISVKSVGDAGNVFNAGETWSLRISSVSGTDLTPIRVMEGIATPVGTSTTDVGWLTWNLSGADAVTLNPNADYAFDLYSSTGWFGIDATQSDDGYANGTAFNSASAGNRTFADTTLGNLTDHGYDRTFHVALSAVPEPAAGLMAACGLAGLLAPRKRS